MQGPARRVVATVVVAGLALAGCSSSDPLEDPAGAAGDGDEVAAGGEGDAQAVAGLTDQQRTHLVDDAETTWDVTYAEETVVVDGAGLDALVSGDDASGTYTFDASAAADAGIELSEGSVLLLAGRALRRVTSVQESGGQTTVQSEQASLADAIEDGTVAWDVPVTYDFDQFVTATDGTAVAPGSPGEVTAAGAGTAQLASVSMVTPDGEVVPVADDSLEITSDPEAGSVDWVYTSDGNTYKFRLTSQGDAVDLLVVVSRGAEGNEDMAFRGEGTIGSMRSVASNSYGGGELTSSDVDLQGLAADVDVSLSVAGAGVAPVDFTIPVPMLTFTWLVGPVPVTLDLKAEIIGNVNAQANASATAAAAFSYRGDAGFAFDGADVSMSGDTSLAEMDPESADSAAGMGIDVDAQFGVGFPHVSLSMLGQGLVPYLRSGAVIGSNLQWGGPAAGFPASSICKSAYVRMEVSGGYDFTILGTSLASDKTVLYEDENETQNDTCPDEE